MAYNNGFPMGYGYAVPQMQPAMQQPQMQPPQPQQQSNMIWVLGEAGAKSYLLSPNTTLALWDSEAQTIYIKSSDASGMPSMKVIDYKVREDSSAAKTPLNEKTDEYVTKTELENFKNEVSEMIKKELEA